MTRDQRTWVFLGIGCALLLGAAVLSSLGPDEQPEPARDEKPLGTLEPMTADGGAANASGEPAPAALKMGPGGEPVPPRQDATWQAPAGQELPADAVDALGKLYALGLPDPRGCEYRRVTLKVTRGRDCTLAPVDVHAFVLPGTDPQGQRWAIAWDGLIHPLEQVGPPADLKFDVLDGLDFHRDDQHQVRDLATLRVRGLVFPDAWTGVQQGLVRPVRAALLWRLGEGELVQRVWAAWLAGRHPKEGGPAQANLLADWLWARYHRALCAHARGDDALAGRDAARLVALKPRLAEALAEQGQSCPFGQGAEEDCAWFWSAAQALTGDAGGGSAPPLAAGQAAQRIAALAEATPSADPGQPTGPAEDLGPDPFGQLPQVQAVVALGAEAGDPLLACLADETNLSRAVWATERVPSADGSEVMTVHEPVGTYRLCYAALQRFLGCAGLPWVPSGPGTDAQAQTHRKAAVAAARAFIDRHGQQPVDQRCLAVLSGADMPPARLAEAARTLVAMPDTAWFARPEAARLTALLDERAEEIDRGGQQAKLGRDLWMETISRRIEAGDDGAFGDWRRVMLASKPFARSGVRALAYFSPLIQHPDHPESQQVARGLFGRDDSPWLPLLARRDWNWGPELLRSPLLKVEAFQRRVLARLADERPAGRYGKPLPDDTWEFEPTVWDAEDARPEQQRLRVCDLYAYQLGRLTGAPAFQTDWDLVHRDEALVPMRDFVSGPLTAAIVSPDAEHAHSRIAFPGRHKPATRADVKAGRAVFSLQGLGEVRIHPLPRVPLPAWWQAPSGRERARIWQAETLQRDNREQTFVGLVWTHGVSMVPADEILLDPGPGVEPRARLTEAPNVALLLGEPGYPITPDRPAPDPSPRWMTDLIRRRASQAGGPFRVTLGVINLGLEPVQVPDRLTRVTIEPDGSRIERLVTGVGLAVSFAPVGPLPGQASFAPLHPRHGTDPDPPGTTRLSPLGWKTWELDLAGLYAIDDPGRLRVALEHLPGLGAPIRQAGLEFEIHPAR